jgi:hypothetical protein
MLSDPKALKRLQVALAYSADPLTAEAVILSGDDVTPTVEELKSVITRLLERQGELKLKSFLMEGVLSDIERLAMSWNSGLQSKLDVFMDDLDDLLRKARA